MLKGNKVGLRARYEDDIPVLRAELYDDVVNGSRAEGRPWRPITPGSKDSRLVVDDKEQGLVPFSVVEAPGRRHAGRYRDAVGHRPSQPVRAHRVGAAAVLARQGLRHRRGRGAVPLRFRRARPAAAADRDAVGQRRDAARRRAQRLRPRGCAALRPGCWASSWTRCCSDSSSRTGSRTRRTSRRPTAKGGQRSRHGRPRARTDRSPSRSSTPLAAPSARAPTVWASRRPQVPVGMPGCTEPSPGGPVPVSFG